MSERPVIMCPFCGERVTPDGKKNPHRLYGMNSEGWHVGNCKDGRSIKVNYKLKEVREVK